MRRDDIEFGTLGPGDMVGYMKLTKMHSNDEINDEHKFDLVGTTHGFIAILPFKEVRKM